MELMGVKEHEMDLQRQYNVAYAAGHTAGYIQGVFAGFFFSAVGAVALYLVFA